MYILQLHYICFLVLTVLVKYLEIYIYSIMSCENKRQFYSIWMLFFSKSLDSTFSIMLSRNVKSGHACLVSSIREKVFILSLFSTMIPVGLPYIAFIKLRHCRFILKLFRVFIIM